MRALLFLLVVSVTLNAQDTLQIDSSTGKVKIERVVKLGSQIQDSLYVSAKAWMEDKFTKPNRAVIYENREEGKIFGTFVAEYTVNGVHRPFINTFKVYLKDGEARIVLTDIQLKTGDKWPVEKYLTKKDGSLRRTHNILWDDLTRIGNRFIDSIDEHLKTKTLSIR